MTYISENVHQLPDVLSPFEHLNNQSDIRETLEVNSNYKSISELLQDEQMFRLDQDPQVFDINSEDLNNSIELEDMKSFGEVILTQDYIPAAEEIDIFSELQFFDSNDPMEDKNKDIDSPTLSPLPAPPLSPVEQPILSTNKSTTITQPTMIKMEQNDDDNNFDLVEFINSNEVSTYLLSYIMTRKL